MFVVRPLNVIASTWNTDVTRKEMVFMSWLAPRGIGGGVFVVRQRAVPGWLRQETGPATGEHLRSGAEGS